MGATEQRKALLIVLFVPSVDRESRPIDQTAWTRRSLELLGRLFGGATAFPRAQGVWRDDERGGRLVWDEPVIVHCYAAARDVRGRANQTALGDFCREMRPLDQPRRGWSRDRQRVSRHSAGVARVKRKRLDQARLSRHLGSTITGGREGAGGLFRRAPAGRLRQAALPDAGGRADARARPSLDDEAAAPREASDPDPTRESSRRGERARPLPG